MAFWIVIDVIYPSSGNKINAISLTTNTANIEIVPSLKASVSTIQLSYVLRTNSSGFYLKRYYMSNVP